jgi:hypothetical protein
VNSVKDRFYYAFKLRGKKKFYSSTRYEGLKINSSFSVILPSLYYL